MTPFNTPADFKRDLKGPADLYEILLTVKYGYASGAKLGCFAITKAEAKRAGIRWDFILTSIELLGLRIENRHGRHGHLISL